MKRTQTPTRRGPSLWNRIRHWITTHRRFTVAILLCAAVAMTVQALIPSPVATESVAVAARPLRAGNVIQPGDVRLESVARELVPEGATRNADALVGKRLASTVAAGGVIAESTLVGPGFMDALGPGIVAVPVTPTDPKILPLLREGARVDIYRLQEGGTPDADSAVLTASGATVLWIESSADPGILNAQQEPGLVVLAVKQEESAAVSALSLAAQIQLVLTG